ncbi:exonuclease SbcCD subunit D [Geotoga petraea]|uniref:Nuclease SbcCD subunit D n=1 Tax=Geotoga petraea TaxID=28234 RepID=A0A1G6NUG2_9BACT|nr:exonuclease SbcCD subunit D [Geotoga petraea]SDC71640.1 Exodeoxyribonuclease I subunit D [Geotoga petraea]
MKIIHTADWHLGKIIYSNYMTEDQKYILNNFITYLKQNKPDVLIIAGDLYDRAVPPSEAVNLLNKTLSKIVLEMKIPTLIISGNHDSSERLEFLNGILSGMDLHIEGTLKKEIKKVTFNDSFGPVNFYLLPYVEFQKARDIFEIDFENKTQALKHYIDNININEKERNILISHEYIMGGEESESERPLSIGGSEFVDFSVFEIFDYVALGHLHRPQKFKNEKINYSGSLLKYSFSESNNKKGMNLVKIKEKGNIDVQKISFETERDMRVMKGLFDEIMKEESTDDYLQIILENEKPVYDAINKLRSKFPNVLSLDFPNLKTNDDIKTSDKNIKDISPVELFESFYEEVKQTQIKKEEKEIVENIFNEILTKRSDK